MSSSQSETPLFAKYYDFLVWLVPRLEGYPRSQRFLLASRLLDAANEGYDQLIRARKVQGAAKAQALLTADVELEKIRLYLRLSQELRCISLSQYEHGARLVNELGRLLGSWRFPKKSPQRPT